MPFLLPPPFPVVPSHLLPISTFPPCCHLLFPFPLSSRSAIISTAPINSPPDILCLPPHLLPALPPRRTSTPCIPSCCCSPFQLRPSSISPTISTAPIYSQPLQTIPAATPTSISQPQLATNLHPDPLSSPTFPSCCHLPFELPPSSSSTSISTDRIYSHSLHFLPIATHPHSSPTPTSHPLHSVPAATSFCSSGLPAAC